MWMYTKHMSKPKKHLLTWDVPNFHMSYSLISKFYKKFHSQKIFVAFIYAEYVWLTNNRDKNKTWNKIIYLLESLGLP